MRRTRVIVQNRCYHLMSRLAHRAFFLNEEERCRAVELMRRVEEFSGVQVLAYAFMSNHFHILIYVPEMEEIDEAEILRRIRVLYHDMSLRRVLEEWDSLKEEDSKMRRKVRSPAKYVSRFDEFKRSYLRRMCNSAEFMRTYKQHFTMSFNARREHFGTMWEGRYHDRNHPPEAKVMWETASYIDINPVRAGLAAKAEDYEWCSFGAAMRGDEKARAGYSFIYGSTQDWKSLRAIHLRSIDEALRRDREKHFPGCANDDDEDGSGIAKRLCEPTSRKDPGLDTPAMQSVLLKRGSNAVAANVLQLLKGGEMRSGALREAVGIKNRTYFNNYYIAPLVAMGMIAPTDATNRNSPRRGYRLTAKGASTVSTGSDPVDTVEASRGRV